MCRVSGVLARLCIAALSSRCFYVDGAVEDNRSRKKLHACTKDNVSQHVFFSWECDSDGDAYV